MLWLLPAIVHAPTVYWPVCKMHHRHWSLTLICFEYFQAFSRGLRKRRLLLCSNEGKKCWRGGEQSASCQSHTNSYTLFYNLSQWRLLEKDWRRACLLLCTHIQARSSTTLLPHHPEQSFLLSEQCSNPEWSIILLKVLVHFICLLTLKYYLRRGRFLLRHIS